MFEFIKNSLKFIGNAAKSIWDFLFPKSKIKIQKDLPVLIQENTDNAKKVNDLNQKNDSANSSENPNTIINQQQNNSIKNKLDSEKYKIKQIKQCKDKRDFLKSEFEDIKKAIVSDFRIGSNIIDPEGKDIEKKFLNFTYTKTYIDGTENILNVVDKMLSVLQDDSCLSLNVLNKIQHNLEVVKNRIYKLFNDLQIHQKMRWDEEDFIKKQKENLKKIKENIPKDPFLNSYIYKKEINKIKTEMKFEFDKKYINKNFPEMGDSNIPIENFESYLNLNKCLEYQNKKFNEFISKINLLPSTVEGKIKKEKKKERIKEAAKIFKTIIDSKKEIKNNESKSDKNIFSNIFGFYKQKNINDNNWKLLNKIIKENN